tara:strand:- start:298 stop:1578 length:1281 start_codon:yes stop_codon:yes gene_type:complete
MTETFYIFVFPIILLFLFQNNFLKVVGKNIRVENETIDFLLLNVFIFLNISLFLSMFFLKIESIILILALYLFFSSIIYFKTKNNFLYFKKFSIFLLIFYIFSFYIISNPDLGWDGKFHWYKRALNFFQNMGFENLSTLPKYEYPHLGSFIWALFWKAVPIAHEYFGRLFFLFLYLISIFSIVDLIKDKSFKYFLFISLSIICFNLNHFLGNQDILVFSLLLILSRYLYLIFEREQENLFNFMMFIFINNIIFWIKYESIIYLLTSYLVVIFFKLFKKNYKYLYLIFLGFVLSLMFKFLIYKHFQVNLNASFQFSGDYDLNSLFDFKIIIYKLFFIFKYYLISLFKNPIMIISFLTIIILFIKNVKLSKENLIIYALLNLSTFFIFFIIQSDFEWHVTNGIDRYMLQYSGFSILFIIIFVNKILKK